ncbi:MAG: sugar phosphate isomerase/epimerase family protein [Deinococcota bacterium]
MKLAVSNIAWPAEDDAAAYELLHAYGVRGLEVAPTRVWGSWDVSPGQVEALRADLNARGFQCSSLQAILYSKPELTVFDGNPSDLYKHMQHVARIASTLGAGPLVFGSPKNRRKGDRSLEEAMDEAAPVFQKIAAICLEQGVTLGLEPNPTDYTCDFLTNAADAAQFVAKVGHPGLKLHLDAAGMYLAGDDAAEMIRDYGHLLVHIHASEPFLGSLAEPQVDHASIASALHEINWQGWVSLEMRASETPLASLETSLETFTQIYGNSIDGVRA